MAESFRQRQAPATGAIVPAPVQAITEKEEPKPLAEAPEKKEPEKKTEAEATENKEA